MFGGMQEGVSGWMQTIHWFRCLPLEKQVMGAIDYCGIRDRNEEYFPFVYVVVEAKTKDSWTWFINLLLVDECLCQTSRRCVVYSLFGCFYLHLLIVSLRQ